MNRLKLWVFTLLVVAAGFLLAHVASTARRADAVAALDARLASAAAHVGAATNAAGREAASAAALIARDETLLSAVRAPAPPAPPPPAPKGRKAPPPAPPAPAPDPAAQDAAAQAAGKAALDKAEKALGFDLPQGTQVIAASQASLVRKSDETEVGALLRAASGGQSRRALVRQGGTLFATAARPAGDGGVVVLVPLDDAWARRLAPAAGVDLTLAVPEVKPVSTARGVDPALLHGATRLAGAGDVGRPTDVELALGPVKLPKLPQPIAGGAPVRARAVPLEGVKGGYVVASLAAVATVNPPAVFLWWALLGLAGVLLLGLVLGFFVRSTEPTPQVPEALLSAAAKIEKGDFSARAPALAGKFGTVAAALNHAAELAGPAKAAKGAPGAAAAPATTDEWFQAGLAGGGRGADEAARAPTVVSAPAVRGGTLAAVAAPVSVPGPEADEETHWQQVFQDFLRTRASCGENAEGLTYERFRQKLEGNKAQLVAKYGCKTVRFQVYVKDGKAALKATPVK
jgi:hypothetical protein